MYIIVNRVFYRIWDSTPEPFSMIDVLKCLVGCGSSQIESRFRNYTSTLAQNPVFEKLTLTQKTILPRKVLILQKYSIYSTQSEPNIVYSNYISLFQIKQVK